MRSTHTPCLDRYPHGAAARGARRSATKNPGRTLTVAILVFAQLALATLSPGMATPAKAQIPVTDILNLAQNIFQVLRAIQQVANQVRQLEAMYRNLLQVANPSWRDLRPYFQRLNELARQGRALAYSIEGIYGLFRQSLPGYTPMEPGRFREVYTDWSNLTLDTLAATLDTASAQAQDYADTQEQLRDLRAVSDAAEGNLQALQAGNMLQGHIAQEVAKLNQLLAAHMNAQNVALGHSINLEASREATLQWMLDESVQPWTPYTGQNGFTGIPEGWPFRCLGCGS